MHYILLMTFSLFAVTPQQDLWESTGIQEKLLWSTQQNIISVERGDSLRRILLKNRVPYNKVLKIIRTLRKVYNPRKLKPGVKIQILYSQEKVPMKKNIPVGLCIYLKNGTRILGKERNTDWPWQIIKPKFNKIPRRFDFVITSSFLQDGLNKGIPQEVLMNTISVLGHELDFQRDIFSKDKVSLLTNEYYFKDQWGEHRKWDKVLYISYKGKEREVEIIRREDSDNSFPYYSLDGQNVRKLLSKNPIPGARLSSSYGWRRHPILRYRRIHGGLDFAAPRGTKIFATGDGVVAAVGRSGGLGRYIKIKHLGNTETLYAHLSSFARGMRRGKRVSQGQFIGRVGSSGLATGPHLHYEVHINGQRVNPRKLKAPMGKPLEGEKLQEHLAKAEEIKSLWQDQNELTVLK